MRVQTALVMPSSLTSLCGRTGVSTGLGCAAVWATCPQCARLQRPMPGPEVHSCGSTGSCTCTLPRQGVSVTVAWQLCAPLIPEEHACKETSWVWAFGVWRSRVCLCESCNGYSGRHVLGQQSTTCCIAAGHDTRVGRAELLMCCTATMLHWQLGF